MLRPMHRSDDVEIVKRELRFFVPKDGPPEAPDGNQHCTWGTGSDEELGGELANITRSTTDACSEELRFFCPSRASVQ